MRQNERRVGVDRAAREERPVINPISSSQDCLRELARLRDQIRCLDRRIEGRRRRHRRESAQRMRRWLQLGGSPQDLLRTMHREKGEQLQGRTREQVAYLANFFDLGIRAAEAESRRSPYQPRPRPEQIAAPARPAVLGHPPDR